MRTLMLVMGMFGAILVVSGLIAGIGGLGLEIANPCSPTYQVSLQPVDSVTNPPDKTVAFESLTTYQQTAVEAAMENRTRVTFKFRERLDPLTQAVIVLEENRYVVAISEDPCRSLYDELALGGFAGAILGCFVVMFSIAVWRLS